MTDETYDSTADTRAHIRRVGELLDRAIDNLRVRAMTHDQSKLGPAEKAAFDHATPRLASLKYNSDQYHANLDEMGPAIRHHYAHNPHHPEYYADGVAGMSLLDLIEMLCDWKAAAERHGDEDFARALDVNRDRFAIDPQLDRILRKTARELGLLER